MQSVASAIIVAAGKGMRMNTGRPKQYLTIADRPVLSHTLQRFLNCRQVGIVYLVVPQADIEFCRDVVLEPFHPDKPIRLVSGGAERQQSVFNGLKAAEGQIEDGLIIIHDGVRPLVQAKLIAECVRQAEKTGACIAGIPAYDTIKRVNHIEQITETVNRNGLWLAQTPQVFRYELIRKAHEKALAEGYTGTDDAGLVERLGHPVSIIPGSKANIKITTQEDLAVATALLQDYGAAWEEGKG